MFEAITMALTPIAHWLNTFFAGFDESIFTFAHNLHEGALGGFLDALLITITDLGNGGIIFIAMGLVFLLFKKTRKAGFGMLLALVFGLIFTNLCIKGLVARPRPYADEAAIFHQWWLEMGHGVEGEIYSFPSGHTTSAFAAMGAMFAFLNKKWSWVGFVFAGLMGFSRIYIFVHYPSDILAGIVIGIICAALAYMVVSLIYKRIDSSDGKAASFIKNASVIKTKKKA